MSLDDRTDGSFLRLADNLRELEVVIGEKARPVVAEVRAHIIEAVTRRQNADAAGALALLRDAMARLAALGTELDDREGALMLAIAQRFTAALSEGDKGMAKEAVAMMRKKAGDTRDEDEW